MRGAAIGQTLKLRGSNAADMRRIAPPLPAASQPSKTITADRREQVRLLDLGAASAADAEPPQVRCRYAAVLVELVQSKLLPLPDDLGSLRHGGARGSCGSNRPSCRACYEENYPKPPRCSTRSRHWVRAFLADPDADGIGVARDYGREIAAWATRRVDGPA